MDFITITPEEIQPKGHLEDMQIKLEEWIHIMFYPQKFGLKLINDRKIENDDFIAPINVGKFYNALLILLSEIKLSESPRARESLTLIIMKSLQSFSAIDFSQVYFKLREKIVLEANKDWGTE